MLTRSCRKGELLAPFTARLWQVNLVVEWREARVCPTTVITWFHPFDMLATFFHHCDKISDRTTWRRKGLFLLGISLQVVPREHVVKSLTRMISRDTPLLKALQSSKAPQVSDNAFIRWACSRHAGVPNSNWLFCSSVSCGGESPLSLLTVLYPMLCDCRAGLSLVALNSELGTRQRRLSAIHNRVSEGWGQLGAGTRACNQED